MVWEIKQGASPVSQKSLPESGEQIFIMSQNISDALKENLAWATYVLLRNTNSISVVSSQTNRLIESSYSCFFFLILDRCQTFINC